MGHHHKRDCEKDCKKCKKNCHPLGSKKNPYDYVIVGLGTAGAPLAKFLSDDPKKTVFVLETGLNRRNDPLVDGFGPAAQAPIFADDPKYHWARIANIANLAQPSASAVTAYQDGLLWGGSSGHNYGLAVRGAPATYNLWATESGNPQWAYNNVLPAMLQLEKFNEGPASYPIDTAQRGTQGPLDITQGTVQNPANGFLTAFATATNSPTVDDYNDPTTGVCVTATGEQGYASVDASLNFHRAYSVTAFMNAGIVDDQGNGVGKRQLTIQSDALVDKVLFKGTAAEAVAWNTSGDTTPDCRQTTYAKKIILSAGSVGNAAILQRSGIGDPAILNPLHIPIVVANANVGANLQTHYGPGVMIPVNFDALPPFEGMLAFIDLSGANLGAPTGVRQFQALMFPNQGGLDPAVTQVLGLDGVLNINVLGWNLQPGKTGTVKITTPDPAIEPELTFNFYTDTVAPTDADRTVKFYKAMQNVSLLYSGSPLLYPPVGFFPAPYGPAPDDSQLREAAKGVYSITNHNSGTCRMSNSMATGVVDGNLDVFGVTGLSVCDNSVAPEINTGNTAYTAYILGMIKAKIEGAPVTF